jgi:energy-coupling factor transporter ATP-binding protein EcfA2
MKIQSINVQNFCGLRAAGITLKAPVIIIAGRNGSGKSSLIEAVRLAMIGKADRVGLKKNYDQLVTDGAKKGLAAIEIFNTKDLTTTTNSITLPNGIGQHMAYVNLPFVLDASMFVRLSENEKRGMLFDLTDFKISTEVIVAKLINRNCAPGKIKEITIALKDGVEIASRFAKHKALESKGAWRATTNETYGEVKAASWNAPVVETAELSTAETVEIKLAEWQGHVIRVNQELGGLNEKFKQLGANNARITTLHTKANSIDRIKAKIEEDQKQQANWAAKLQSAQNARLSQEAQKCPCCQEWIVMKDGKLMAAAPLTEGSDDDIASIGEYKKAYDLFTTSIANGQRDLLTAESAAEELSGLGAVQTSEQIQKKIDEARIALTHSQAQLKQFEAQKSQIVDAQRKSESAAKATENALKYHTDVVEWSAIGDALAPDGIPAEILESALEQVNRRLCASSIITGWKQVRISEDMQITADGRAYALLSESEQWRCDAMLAEAISHLSGLNLMVLDRMDVLDLPARSQLLKWLNELASSKEIDTAIVCGTLKEAFKEPNANFESFWIEGGLIGVMQAA